MQQEALCPAMQRRLERATEKMASYVSGVVGIESQVRQVLDGKATGGTIIPIQTTPFYLAFGHQCYKLQRGEFSGTSGNMVCQCLKAVWVARGLNATRLAAIIAIITAP